MIDVDDFAHRQMRALGSDVYQKFLHREIIEKWEQLVGADIAAKVRPIAIEFGVLYVDLPSSAWKDQLKFFTEEIFDALNENFPQSESLVKEIRIAKSFQVAANPPPQKFSPEESAAPVTIDEIILTDEEVARCRSQATKKFPEGKLRETVFQTLLAQARVQKFRLATGWHKCKRCETLCPPEEIFCEACKIRERETMLAELFKIFYDAPQIKTRDAQKILLERMPHMRRECSPDVIESARTSLIQKVAGRVRFGDEKSPDVLKLVALEKRLPLEQLTPAIIRRTLIDLQFNLSEQPKLQRYLSKVRK